MSQTLTTLAARIDQLSTKTDERFDKMQNDVDEAFADQRRYTDFALGKMEKQVMELRMDMNAGFGPIDRKLDRAVDLLTAARPRRRRT